MTETERVPGTIQGCIRHGYREHTVGESPNGWDVIEVVCPDCGYRLLEREVMSNPDGERRSDYAPEADTGGNE